MNNWWHPITIDVTPDFSSITNVLMTFARNMRGTMTTGFTPFQTEERVRSKAWSIKIPVGKGYSLYPTQIRVPLGCDSASEVYLGVPLPSTVPYANKGTPLCPVPYANKGHPCLWWCSRYRYISAAQCPNYSSLTFHSSYLTRSFHARTRPIRDLDSHWTSGR